jgi:hypothetical protein
MRSSWVLPFFHRTAASGLVGHPSQGHQAALPCREKAVSQSRAQAPTLPTHPRLCLGIGDGMTRRQ